MAVSCRAFGILFIVPALAATVAGVAPRPKSQDNGDRFCGLIEVLNACIQERFKDVDEAFGFRRITKTRTPHRFEPENVREELAVRDLEREGLGVMLYLAGRRVLDARPATDALASHVIRGPVAVTSVSPPAGPQPRALWDEAARAMSRFATAETYDFSAGSWTFHARPVRATDTVCLRCHVKDRRITYGAPANRVLDDAVNLGDPLGVVLYGYEKPR
jgi:hypothetical protein